MVSAISQCEKYRDAFDAAGRKKKTITERVCPAAIAFTIALPATDHPVRSTTFQALESLGSEVVRESPDVYYEIQAKNPYSAAALKRLSSQRLKSS